MPSASVQQSLRQHGFRLTRARRAVLSVLDQTSAHFKASDLHREVRALAPTVGLASVYRTLDLLSRLGLLKHVQMNHWHRHYAATDDGHGHHLVCNGCGRVVEFTDCQIEKLAKTLARRTRFVIEGHSVELYGRCPDCRRSPGPETSNRPAPNAPAKHRRQESSCG